MKKNILKLVLLYSVIISKTFAQSLMIADFENEIAVPTSPVLIFQSGFEGTTQLSAFQTTNLQITGSDPNLTLSNWTTFKTNEVRTLYLNFAGGATSATDTTKRYANIIADPTNSTNKVLHYCVKDSWTTDGQIKARCQFEFYDIKNGYKEFYQSVRVYFSKDFEVLRNYPKTMDWFTIAEFWNNQWWGNVPYEFRITLTIYKYSGAGNNLYFAATAENLGFIKIWNNVNTNIPVPIGQWVTLDYYFREGNKDTGRFYVAMTPDGGSKQVIFDIHDYTHETTDSAPDGLTGYNPMKLYTSQLIMDYVKSQGKALHIYWDDFKIWKNKRP